MIVMQFCSFSNSNLNWDEQFSPLMGEKEVEKLKYKFLEMNVELDTLRIPYGSLFPYPPPQFEDLFFALLNRIGSWPLVIQFLYITYYMLDPHIIQDSSEYVLLSLMVLFCPDDMPDLVDRKTVEEIQNYYAVLLQKYLNKK